MIGVGEPPSAAWYQGQQAAQQRYQSGYGYQNNDNQCYLNLCRLASLTPPAEPVKPKPEPKPEPCDPEAVRFSKLELD